MSRQAKFLATTATPAAFAMNASQGRWLPYRHAIFLSVILCEVAAGRITRLLVEMPPRHGKSTLVSHYFPAWYLGNFPDKRIILASYEADFAAQWGRGARELLEEYGPRLFGVSVSQTSAAANRWNIAKREGGMQTAGAGGAITGKGANVLLIEDPIKNDQQALSASFRDKLWNWYLATASTRLDTNDSAVIIIQTRWHQDDLPGRLMVEADKGGEKWVRVRFPAIAEENDPDDPSIVGNSPHGWREVGEALCPERFNLDHLRRIERRLGPFWWNSLYQQRPTAEKGDIFRRDSWAFYQERPAQLDLAWFDEIIQTWDMAFKEARDTDYVVGMILARKGADTYVLDMTRERLDFPKTIERVEWFSAKWPEAKRKLVEDKANGPAVVATLKKKIPGMIAVNPKGSKISRARAVSPNVDSGNVLLPLKAHCPWVAHFIEEMADFPNAAHDDIVDAFSQGMLYFEDRSGKPILLAKVRR